MVSASTLIGPFEFDRALATRPLLTCDRAVNVLYSHENLKTLELIVNAELNNLFNRLTSNKLTRKGYGSQTLANCS